MSVFTVCFREIFVCAARFVCVCLCVRKEAWDLPPRLGPAGRGRKRSSGNSFSGLMYTLALDVNEAALTPSTGFTVKY